jgi:DNA-binding NarL/FixJ family response regulator
MAIKNVLTGKSYLSPGIAETVLEGYLEGRKTLKPRSSWETLTRREREILKLIAEGYKNKEIKENFVSALRRLKSTANIMTKLTSTATA